MRWLTSASFSTACAFSLAFWGFFAGSGLAEAQERAISRAPFVRAEAAPIRFSLPNGLAVVLQPLAGRRFAAVRVQVAAGAAYEPEGWAGLARLTQRVVAGLDRPRGAAAQLEAMGSVSQGVHVDADHTAFEAVVPSAQLERALWVEAHRLARSLAVVTEAQLERQRVWLAEQADEQGLFGVRGALRRARYAGVFPAGHPYTRLVEREADVHTVALSHVQWFFQRFYAPDRTTLTVVGGFDPARIRAAIARHFGPIERSGPAPERQAREALRAPPWSERRLALRLPIRRDRVEVAWRTPPRFTRGDRALQVVAERLSDPQGPLQTALRAAGLGPAEVGLRRHARGSLLSISMDAVHRPPRAAGDPSAIPGRGGAGPSGRAKPGSPRSGSFAAGTSISASSEASISGATTRGPSVSGASIRPARRAAHHRNAAGPRESVSAERALAQLLTFFGPGAAHRLTQADLDAARDVHLRRLGRESEDLRRRARRLGLSRGEVTLGDAMRAFSDLTLAEVRRAWRRWLGIGRVSMWVRADPMAPPQGVLSEPAPDPEALRR